jgi:hypothetical protein
MKNYTKQMVKRTKIVVADSVDDAKKLCIWATIFQRTKDYKISNRWICSSFN